MINDKLAEIKAEIKVLEKKVKKEKDQGELYKMCRRLQDLYVEEFEIEKQ